MHGTADNFFDPSVYDPQSGQCYNHSPVLDGVLSRLVALRQPVKGHNDIVVFLLDLLNPE
jgi:hypothetical protein